MCRHPLKCDIQLTGCLAGSHHAAHDVREYLRILGQRLRQGLALSDLGMYAADCLRHRDIFGLVCKHVERVKDRNARTHHADELAAEHGQIPRLYRLADRDIDLLGKRGCLRDIDDGKALVLELGSDLIYRLRLHVSFFLFSGLVDDQIIKLCQRVKPSLYDL